MKEVKKKSPARIYLTFAVVLIICGLIGGISGAHHLRPHRRHYGRWSRVQRVLRPQPR